MRAWASSGAGIARGAAGDGHRAGQSETSLARRREAEAP